MTGKEELSYKILIVNGKTVIEPAIKDVLKDIKEHLKAFLLKLDRFNYKLVRVSEFAFITGNIIRQDDKD